MQEKEKKELKRLTSSLPNVLRNIVSEYMNYGNWIVNTTGKNWLSVGKLMNFGRGIRDRYNGEQPKDFILEYEKMTWAEVFEYAERRSPSWMICRKCGLTAFYIDFVLSYGCKTGTEIILGLVLCEKLHYTTFIRNSDECYNVKLKWNEYVRCRQLKQRQTITRSLAKDARIHSHLEHALRKAKTARKRLTKRKSIFINASI